MILVDVMCMPVISLIYSNDGIVQWNSDGIRLSLFGSGVTREHCVSNVSGAVLGTMQKELLPLICEILMAPHGFFFVV